MAAQERHGAALYASIRFRRPRSQAQSGQPESNPSTHHLLGGPAVLTPRSRRQWRCPTVKNYHPSLEAGSAVECDGSHMPSVQVPVYLEHVRLMIEAGT